MAKSTTGSTKTPARTGGSKPATKPASGGKGGTATAPAKTSKPSRAASSASSSAPATGERIRPMNQAEYFAEWSTMTNQPPKVCREMYAALMTIATRELGKKGRGVFQLPGLVKFSRVTVAARPARQGRNPSTGETITIAAQKAHPAIRAKPLGGLNDLYS